MHILLYRSFSYPGVIHSGWGGVRHKLLKFSGRETRLRHFSIKFRMCASEQYFKISIVFFFFKFSFINLIRWKNNLNYLKIIYGLWTRPDAMRNVDATRPKVEGARSCSRTIPLLPISYPPNDDAADTALTDCAACLGNNVRAKHISSHPIRRHGWRQPPGWVSSPCGSKNVYPRSVG